MKELTIPKKLEPIVKAFWAESPKAAKALVMQATQAIYGGNEEDDFDAFSFKKKHVITPEELESVCAMMAGLKPADMLEALYAAQIVATHLLGLRRLARGCSEDLRIGLRMLQFSSDSMAALHKKRTGGLQNITVNYNYAGKPPPLSLIADDGGAHVL